MALLRDARTSAVLAEGTPLTVALAARELGGLAVVVGLDEHPGDADYIYDDVGLGFDPDAVIAAHEENVAGLEAGAKDADGDEAERLAAAATAAREHHQTAAELAQAATVELEAARKLVD